MITEADMEAALNSAFAAVIGRVPTAEAPKVETPKRGRGSPKGCRDTEARKPRPGKPNHQRYFDCAAAGMSQADAARHLGVTRERVRQVANQYGITFGTSIVHVRAQLRREAVAHAAKVGLSGPAIAEVFGCHPSRASQLAKAAGIKLYRKTKGGLYDDALRQACADGLSTTEAAERLGMWQPHVSAAAKRLGLKFRDGRRS